MADTGGQVEVMIERALGAHEALAQIRATKSPKPGTRLRLEDALDVEVLGRAGEFFHLRFPEGDDLIALLERHGRLPLPPYIERAAGDTDESRYQTVYARNPGSVAAPTAGLHFDDALLARLAEHGVHTAYVTLNVGAGTFQPVRVHDLSEHKMHTEAYFVPQATVDAITATKAAGKRVVCVGTTSMRGVGDADDGKLGLEIAAPREPHRREPARAQNAYQCEAPGLVGRDRLAIAEPLRHDDAAALDRGRVSQDRAVEVRDDPGRVFDRAARRRSGERGAFGARKRRERARHRHDDRRHDALSPGHRGS